MAYQGTGYFGGIRFNDQAAANAYKAGQGDYQTVYNVDPNQPYWGQYVPQGYELVGFRQGSSTQMPFAQQPRQITYRGQAAKDLGPSYAILKRTGSGGTAAAAPAPAAPASSSLQEPQLTAEAKKYREESEAKLAEAQTLLDNFKIEQNKAAEAKKLQEQMAIRAQGTLASNLAMSQRQPSLQLSPASQTPKTAGTQPFKRRRLQVMTPGSQVTSGLNIGSANLLNV